MEIQSILVFIVLLVSRVRPADAADGARENPFTPRASLIRYWNKEIQNDLPKSPFLFSKASPLSAVQAVFFTKLAASSSLGTHLPEFCAAAKLLCSTELGVSLEKHRGNSQFAAYTDKNFTNYGTSSAGGFSSFKNYSNDYFWGNDFRRYSRNSAGRRDSFNIYAFDSNVNIKNFKSYGVGSVGGSSVFTSYNNQSNVPDDHFTSYGDNGNGRSHSFSAYADSGNSGSETFTSYGKNGNGVPSVFTSYANDTNVNSPNFKNYGESGNNANNTFKFYGFNGNVPENNFKNYGNGGTGGVDSFTSYREQSNVGDDSFQSYSKNSNTGKADFVNYGKSYNQGTTKFTAYGEGALDPSTGFKIYGINTTFKEYSKSGVRFSEYTNDSQTSSLEESKEAVKKSGRTANKWVAEPGKFFREKMLKKGTVIPMPDIVDKMQKRAFLPRSISSKLPFSSSKLEDIKRIFHVGEESAMENIIQDALRECERPPSPGETKRCIGSAEDLIDFATTVLGKNVELRVTENTKGSKGNIMVGEVKGVNGGAVTMSVSCHQSLYPYLLYYCHSVPKVRVYEADILDPATESKINHGVAICHVDTSSWSPTHAAFVALGDGPGRIEVCHWIFENDMTWTVAD